MPSDPNAPLLQGVAAFPALDRERLHALVLAMVPQLVDALALKMMALIQLPRPDRGGECWYFDTVTQQWVEPCTGPVGNPQTIP